MGQDRRASGELSASACSEAMAAIEALGALERFADYSERELRRLSPRCALLAGQLRAAIAGEIVERLSRDLQGRRRAAG